MGAGVGAEAELEEDLLDVCFDGALGDEQAGGEGPVGEPLGDQREHLALAFGELVEGAGPAFAGKNAGDDRRVDDCLAVGEAAEGVDQVRDVEDAFFEQVADPFGMLFEQPHGVAGLDVLGEDEHPGTGMLGADLLRGDEALVGVGGRHADVDDGGVGLGGADRAQQRGGVAGLADHVDAGVGEQPGDALAGQHHVLGYDDAHGISARHAVCLKDRLPPSAPTRSASVTMGASRPVPLSSTVTTSCPPWWSTVTAARSAPRRTASSMASATVKYAAASTGAG